jgi:glycosyltransferase involved in cell wall biosynthesis
MMGKFQRAVVIYDILDDLTRYRDQEEGVPLDRRVSEHHPRLMAQAEVVIVSHPSMLDRHRSERDDLVLVENGVDLSLFTPQGHRVDLGEAPVIGFHGAIRPLVDFDLLAGVARARPGYRLVMVGPAIDGADEEMARLERLPNVVHVPEQPPTSLAAHVRSFTVGIMPYRIDETMEVASPMKLNEYLASGVPVVSTPMRAAIDHPAVGTAADLEGFCSLLDRAVGLTGPARLALREHAVPASWDRRIQPLLDRLDETGLRRVP